MPVRFPGLEWQCRSLVRQCRRVSPAEAAVILLRDVFEFGHRDIASIIGRSEAAARQFMHRARLRTRRTDESVDVDESEVGLYWRAIEARDPAPLMRLLQTTTAWAKSALPVGRQPGTRTASVLVQINGRYAVALMLDGVALCIVPVGTQPSLELETG